MSEDVIYFIDENLKELKLDEISYNSKKILIHMDCNIGKVIKNSFGGREMYDDVFSLESYKQALKLILKINHLRVLYRSPVINQQLVFKYLKEIKLYKNIDIKEKIEINKILRSGKLTKKVSLDKIYWQLTDEVKNIVLSFLNKKSPDFKNKIINSHLGKIIYSPLYKDKSLVFSYGVNKYEAEHQQEKVRGPFPFSLNKDVYSLIDTNYSEVNWESILNIFMFHSKSEDDRKKLEEINIYEIYKTSNVYHYMMWNEYYSLSIHHILAFNNYVKTNNLNYLSNENDYNKVKNWVINRKKITITAAYLIDYMLNYKKNKQVNSSFKIISGTNPIARKFNFEHPQFRNTVIDICNLLYAKIVYTIDDAVPNFWTGDIDVINFIRKHETSISSKGVSFRSNIDGYHSILYENNFDFYENLLINRQSLLKNYPDFINWVDKKENLELCIKNGLSKYFLTNLDEKYLLKEENFNYKLKDSYREFKKIYLLLRCTETFHNKESIMFRINRPNKGLEDLVHKTMNFIDLYQAHVLRCIREEIPVLYMGDLSYSSN